MTMITTGRAIAFVGVLLVAVASVAQAPKPSLTTGTRIYVGTMGDSDQADQFRMMLAYELGRSGFKVVDFESQAGAVLTGILTKRVAGAQSVMRATLFLKTPEGKAMWTGDLDGAPADKRKDTVRMRAEEAARMLKREASKTKVQARAREKS